MGGFRENRVENQMGKWPKVVLQRNNVYLTEITEIHPDMTVTPGPYASVRYNHDLEVKGHGGQFLSGLKREETEQ